MVPALPAWWRGGARDDRPVVGSGGLEKGSLRLAVAWSLKVRPSGITTGPPRRKRASASAKEGLSGPGPWGLSSGEPHGGREREERSV